jgi:hypothetical protein
MKFDRKKAHQQGTPHPESVRKPLPRLFVTEPTSHACNPRRAVFRLRREWRVFVKISMSWEKSS